MGIRLLNKLKRSREKEPYYIEILKYLEGRSDDGVQVYFDEIQANIVSRYPNMDERAFRHIYDRATDRWGFLSLDSRFQLLELKELRSAQASSLVASAFAVVAIAFAGVSILLQVTDSNVVLLNAEQIKELFRVLTESN